MSVGTDARLVNFSDNLQLGGKRMPGDSSRAGSPLLSCMDSYSSGGIG